MAIVVYTSAPKSLLEEIKKGIDKGTVDTWIYDKDGDFTHKPEPWENKAWLRPDTSSGVLQLGLLGPKDVEITKGVYGVYHGRFIEMLLTHFDGESQRDSDSSKRFRG